MRAASPSHWSDFTLVPKSIAATCSFVGHIARRWFSYLILVHSVFCNESQRRSLPGLAFAHNAPCLEFSPFSADFLHRPDFPPVPCLVFVSLAVDSAPGLPSRTLNPFFGVARHCVCLSGSSSPSVVVRSPGPHYAEARRPGTLSARFSSGRLRCFSSGALSLLSSGLTPAHCLPCVPISRGSTRVADHALMWCQGRQLHHPSAALFIFLLCKFVCESLQGIVGIGLESPDQKTRGFMVESALPR
jgi:hypothetical protein